jgi:voltage-gated potassium channel Kch
MAMTDFRSRGARFAGSETGSVGISGALFAIALISTAIVAGLGATGLLVAPPLVYLVFAVIVIAAGWDLWRERRKGGGR